MLKNIIKKPYYYIPPCPCCNSNQTGHYVKELGLDPSFTVRESLKNGELAIAVREIPYENVFCLECGFTWHQDIKIKMLSLSQIEEQKQLRGTAEYYNTVTFKEKSPLSKFF